jgi:signal transduction histidine kinase
MARVSVQNQGPPLPEEMRGTLFESMVSVRKERGGAPHLGLGLYIARLVAEFHGGTVSADNLASGDGVVVAATFRVASRHAS